MGLPVEFEIAVSNPSDAPVRIGGIDTSCGCMVFQEASMSIATGATMAIRGVTNTQRLAGDQVTWVYFKSDDGHRRVTSRIRATTVGPVERVDFDPAASEWILHLRESYRGLVSMSQCYIADMDVELPCRLLPDAMEIRVQTPQPDVDFRRIEVVYQIQSPGHDAFEILEEVSLRTSEAP